MFFSTTLPAIRSAISGCPEIVIEKNLLQRIGALAHQHLPLPALIVCDTNTLAAAGIQVIKALPTQPVLRFEQPPQPDMEHIARIREAARDCTSILAVGSGTINDLCKYAAFLENKPYAVVPTAPSMNGYVSANASIIIEGKKQSVSARMPAAVWCDLDVLTTAPSRMIAAGVGDVLCRTTAQADWLLSYYTKNTPYDPKPFEWLLPYEKKLLADPRDIDTLTHMLLISGFGMTLCGGSYPASQGEHMIAHVMNDNQSLHGEQIAVTTLTMSELQWKLNDRDDIKKTMLPTQKLRAALQAAGCPTTPEEIGWDTVLYKEAVAKAKFSRDRFTFLNLATT